MASEEQKERTRRIEWVSLIVGIVLGVAGMALAITFSRSADHLNEQSLTISNATLMAETDEHKLCAGAYILQYLMDDQTNKEFQKGLVYLASRIYMSGHQNVAVPPSVEQFTPSSPLVCTEFSVGQILSISISGKIPQLVIGYFGPSSKDTAEGLKSRMVVLPEVSKIFLASGTYDLNNLPIETAALALNSKEATLYYHDPADAPIAAEIKRVLDTSGLALPGTISVQQWPGDKSAGEHASKTVTPQILELWFPNPEKPPEETSTPSFTPAQVAAAQVKDAEQVYELYKHLPDTDYPNQADIGRSFDSKWTATENACAKLCLNTDHCTVYTYLPPGVKLKHWNGPQVATCFLKKQPWANVRYDGLISGVRNQLPAPPSLLDEPKTTGH